MSIHDDFREGEAAPKVTHTRLAQHSFWCMVMFFAIGTAFAFSVAATRYHANYPRWLLGFGALVALVNLGVQVLFADVCLSEWINVPLLLSYCLLLGLATQQLNEKTSTPDLRISNRAQQKEISC